MVSFYLVGLRWDGVLGPVSCVGIGSDLVCSVCVSILGLVWLCSGCGSIGSDMGLVSSAKIGSGPESVWAVGVKSGLGMFELCRDGFWSAFPFWLRLVCSGPF